MPSRTALLRRPIEVLVPERPVHLELWDDTRLPATDPAAGTLRVRSPRSVAHLLRAPGQLGTSRAGVVGDLDTDENDAGRARWGGAGRWERRRGDTPARTARRRSREGRRGGGQAAHATGGDRVRVAEGER